MPVHVAKRGGKFCLVDDAGKVGKCYDKRADAVAAVQGKNIGMMRQKGDKRAPPKPAAKRS